jgi:FtsZ-interacting cell division protein ZipA
MSILAKVLMVLDILIVIIGFVVAVYLGKKEELDMFRNNNCNRDKYQKHDSQRQHKSGKF